MKRTQFLILTIVALGAGLVGGLLSGPASSPVSAVPSLTNFSYVKVVQRSSTMPAVYAEQRGSGPLLRLVGTAAISDIVSNKPVRIDKLVIVPFGTNAGIVTMTPSPTPTPTFTVTPSPTP